MEKNVVIYAFRSPGSGSVYIGKHECDPSDWPRRGTGRLPDGYKGSGDVVPRFHARHGARAEWRILAVVPLADWPRAERRAIRLARLLLGKKCVNIADGGDGQTGEAMRRYWADPGFVARRDTRLQEVTASPEYQARHLEAVRRTTASPEWREKHRAGLRRRAATEEGLMQVSRAAVAANTPEAVAKRVRTRQINLSWKRLAEQHPEWWADRP